MHPKSARPSFLILLLLQGVLFCSLAFSQSQVNSYVGTGSPGYQDGSSAIALFDSPHGIVMDTAGNLYVCDGANNAIRKVAPDRTVTTFAGTGTAGYQDGPGNQALFDEPYNICIDPAGNLYVSDFRNQYIRKITPGGMVSTLAGTGIAGYLDGPDTVAQFNYPRGICIDTLGNLYIGDSWNHRIRKISPDGTVSTLAGGGTSMGVQSVGDYVDASDTSARFYTPTEVSIDQNQNLYVADAFNHRIRKIDPNGMVSTLAGSGVTGQGGGGFRDGPGNQALFPTPTACYATADGHVYVGDGSSHVIRKIDPSGFVSTFAGTGIAGYLDGPDSLARFNFPRSIVINENLQQLFVAELGNHTIRRVELAPLTAAPELQPREIGVYPNPFTGNLTLKRFIAESSLEVKICDSFGQEIFPPQTWTGAKLELNLSEIPSGVYFLMIRNQGEIWRLKRIVKQ